MPRILVIGIGNSERGDDAAGRAVAHMLRGTVEVAEHNGEPTGLLALLASAETAFLVDACVSGVRPGTIRRFDLADGPLPQTASPVSSHGFGLAEGLELVRALGALPPRCIVYAIEGRSFEAGAGISPRVEQAIGKVARRLRAEFAATEEAPCTKPH